MTGLHDEHFFDLSWHDHEHNPMMKSFSEDLICLNQWNPVRESGHIHRCLIFHRSGLQSRFVSLRSHSLKNVLQGQTASLWPLTCGKVIWCPLQAAVCHTDSVSALHHQGVDTHTHTHTPSTCVSNSGLTVHVQFRSVTVMSFLLNKSSCVNKWLSNNPAQVDV